MRCVTPQSTSFACDRSNRHKQVERTANKLLNNAARQYIGVECVRFTDDEYPNDIMTLGEIPVEKEKKGNVEILYLLRETSDGQHVDLSQRKPHMDARCACAQE